MSFIAVAAEMGLRRPSLLEEAMVRGGEGMLRWRRTYACCLKLGVDSSAPSSSRFVSALASSLYL